MKVIYASPNDSATFEMDRYLESLHKYDTNITAEDVNKALSERTYDPMHVSVLVEVGTGLIGDDKAAEEYYNEHNQWFDVSSFERLRRITGYLVGTLSRWNDAKQAEEKARVKHNIGDYSKIGQYTLDEKAEIEAVKLENSVMSQF